MHHKNFPGGVTLLINIIIIILYIKQTASCTGSELPNRDESAKECAIFTYSQDKHENVPLSVGYFKLFCCKTVYFWYERNDSVQYDPDKPKEL